VSLNSAVGACLGDLAHVPTTVLASLPRVARLAGRPLSADEVYRVTSELGRRHGRTPFSAMFASQADGSFPDYASTSAVADFSRESEDAHGR
jgi:hypothetical protein